jgi:hypothetical protein
MRRGEKGRKVKEEREGKKRGGYERNGEEVRRKLIKNLVLKLTKQYSLYSFIAYKLCDFSELHVLIKCAYKMSI